MSEDYPIEFFDFQIEDETEKAVFVRILILSSGKIKYRWLPKSQLNEFSNQGRKGYKIPAWLCEKKGSVNKK